MIWRHSLAVLALLAATIAPGAQAWAQEFKAGSLSVIRPFANASNIKTAAVYVIVQNNSGEAERLIGASTDIADSAEIHTMSMDNNIMRMRPVEGIDIPPGARLEMLPGASFHIMLINLRRVLSQGESFPLGLTFARTGTVEVQVQVRRIGQNQ